MIRAVLFENRDRAESFGAVAELYDRARPTYPSELIDELVATAPREVLDVGAGTGIASALVAARGCRVLGVEIDARMAAVARAKGLDVEVARFEQWQAGERRFDLVMSAQAWHWVQPRRGAAHAAAMLRAGGRIALFWNLGGPPAHIRRALAAVYDRLEPGIETHATVQERVRVTREGLAASGAFAPPSVSTFRWREDYDAAAWVERLRTKSEYQTLSAERRERLVAAVGQALEALGPFALEHETVLLTAPLRDGAVHR
jgi:SAM-dependent methyltransferase